MKHLIHMSSTCTVKGMAEAIRFFLINSEKMESQILVMDNTDYIVQAKAPSGWKKFIGMDKAINVKLSPVGNEAVEIEIGEGKWADKAIAAAVSWFILWPLAVTSAVGTISQAQLPKKILNAAEIYAIG